MGGLESLLTGRVLADRYRIEEVIGRGGMGAVFRATDERLGRQVAVKVITVAGADDPASRERLRQRFLREARAAAGLPHHPNVVGVYDFGTDPSLGLDFLVMELLRGEDLASLLSRSGAPPLAMGLRILHGAAQGVAVGHRNGLVHRDVKPGNIFLVKDEHGDIQVRVLDFGIAKLVDDDTLSQLTQDGRLPLSPAFASPEQLRGLSQITPASDVFSLGAVGYLVLTGERPFTDSDRNRFSLGMPVDVPPLRNLNPAIPPSVESVVRQALNFEPSGRYPDAITFVRLLDQARREAGETPLPPYEAMALDAAPLPPSLPVEDDDRTEFLDDRTLLDPGAAVMPTAPPTSTPEPIRPDRVPLPRRRRPRQSRGSGWLVAVLVVLVLAGAGGVFAFYTLENRWPGTADIPPPPAEIPPIQPPEVEQEPERGELDAYVHHIEGRRYFETADYGNALEQFQLAVQISPSNPEYRYNYGLTLLRLGQVEAAVPEFERVIRQNPQLAGAHYNLAEAQLTLGDTTAAIGRLETVVDVSTDPAQLTRAERRLREVRAALLSPTRRRTDTVPVSPQSPDGTPQSDLPDAGGLRSDLGPSRTGDLPRAE